MNNYLAELLIKATAEARGETRAKLEALVGQLGGGAELGDAAAGMARGLVKGKAKALTSVAEAVRLAREEYQAACTTLYCLTVARQRLSDDDRTVTPWEQELVLALQPYAETLLAQNAILTEPPKARKGDEAKEALDDLLPTGALARLYTEALGYDSLSKLCGALALDLTKDDDVLTLDAALAGLIGEYGLAQLRAEEVAKRAKKHAEELESQRYALTAQSRQIHERASGIRNLRKNPTIPGVPMEPVPAIQREAPRPAEEAPPTLIPWTQLTVWALDGMPVDSSALPGYLKRWRAGEMPEGCHLVPPDRVTSDGVAVVVGFEKRLVPPNRVALVTFEQVKREGGTEPAERVIILVPDGVDWSDFPEEPAKKKGRRS